MCSMFDIGDYWNCNVHEMKVYKTKNEEFFDKFRQYFIHLLSHMTYCSHFLHVLAYPLQTAK
jgi:hypothetical protein